ncbi:MAG: copper resistance CopC family protein [Thermomicrobiales bacterium]
MFKRKWWSAGLFALMLVAGAILSPARSALAHAEPDITVPPIGGTVDQAPPLLEITFSEEVTAETTIDVVGPDGKSVNAAPAALDLEDANRKHVTVALFGNLPAGAYTVNWTSVSAEDGDPDSGSYTFTVSGGAATPVASPVASPESTPMVAASVSEGGPKDQMNAAAEAAQQAATEQAAAEDNFDGSSYLISVLAGLAGAIFIYLVWRKVRPKPEERFVVQ